MTSRGDFPLPRLNLSGRFVFSDDLSMTKGRHNLKMGVSLELNSKTEPGSADYQGNFDFGHNASNPLSTGNGYANMLLGNFTTYTELTSRVDRDVRHWQNDFYFQDNWRVSQRLTLDLGLRVQHSGSDYEINDMNSGFFTDEWQRNQAARVYRLVCSTGVPGNQPCATNNQRAIDPANPTVFFPSAAAGNLVQGSGVQTNGILTGGIPDRKSGTYFTFPYLQYAPRVGFAWNIFGDGKTALRGSWGIFYNFPRSTGDGGGYPFAGGCPVSCSNQIRWATFNDITTATTANLVANPVNVTMAGYRQTLAKSQNVNIAFQRDIGFNTVAEIAYVGNFSRNQGRQVDANRLPLYVYGNPDNLVNNTALNANSLRQVYGPYPGMGSVNQYSQTSTPRRCNTTPCSCRSPAGCRTACRWGWRTRSPRAKAIGGTIPIPTKSAAKRRSELGTGGPRLMTAGTISGSTTATTSRRLQRCRWSSNCSRTGRCQASRAC